MLQTAVRAPLFNGLLIQPMTRTDSTGRNSSAETNRRALFIRLFEERLFKLFAEGKLNGTVHTCLGQEYSGLAVAMAATPDDVVFSNHRGHGHYLAFHRDAEALMAEIMGRSTGLCGGAGGSQHLYARNFYSNGILGGMSPAAVGVAWARKLREQPGIAIVFHGDGAMGEGVIYEAMNLAARWELPVLWVIERNGYAQSTDCRQTTAGNFSDRARGFGLAHYCGDTWDFERLAEVAASAVRHVRETRLPAMLEIQTYRLAAHSKGDDNRSAVEIAEYKARDLLNRLRGANPQIFGHWESEIAAELDEMVVRCAAAPTCSVRPAWRPRQPTLATEWTAVAGGGFGERYSTIMYQAFVRLFAEVPTLVMIGEDIEDPYGGAFKVTRDLGTRFPGRVRNTPISEAAITGAGAGAALAGLRPIVEIMFGDFLSLTFDQLIQHACKFATMYGGKVKVPLIIRAPMGGRRGYGPTHSQSIEGHFLGVPELDILALNARIDPERLYRALFAAPERPALIIENKILYTRPFQPECSAGYRVFCSSDAFPIVRISPTGSPPQVTIVCYGGMLEIAEEALVSAFQEDEILVEIICPTRLTPLDMTPVRESVMRTGKIVVLEEGKTFAAFGSEILAGLLEANVRCRACRVGYDHYIPSSYTAELELLPSAAQVLAAINRLFHE